MSNKNSLHGANVRTSCISLSTPATDKHSQHTENSHLEPAIRDAQKVAQNVFPPWTPEPPVTARVNPLVQTSSVLTVKDNFVNLLLQGEEIFKFLPEWVQLSQGGQKRQKTKWWWRPQWKIPPENPWKRHFRDSKFQNIPTIVDKTDGKFIPPPPLNQWWENGAFWLLHCFILELAVGGCRSILFCPRL